MTKKSDAALFALDHLFRHESAPPEMIMDGSKEQNLGDFACKLCKAGSKPHLPWINLCETEICESKRGLARKMVK